MLALKDVRQSDLEPVWTLNQAAVPHVGDIDLATMARYKSIAPYFKLAWWGEELAGFMIAMPPGVDYQSPNYQWLEQRYTSHYYIDRLAVAPHLHRRGIGRALYDDVRRAARGHTLLTCEVNVIPPNETSMAFHRSLGFEPLGFLDSDEGRKRVCFLGAPLRVAGP
ncbi:MAG: GNAT family N-acetyltransferase [Gammaproteobacteria bacterium]|nr:GNAT family N-acetyltransferase [Gammaproteobacteria bacterium]